MKMEAQLYIMLLVQVGKQMHTPLTPCITITPFVTFYSARACISTIKLGKFDLQIDEQCIYEFSNKEVVPLYLYFDRQLYDHD